jgi:hypothetical protein
MRRRHRVWSWYLVASSWTKLAGEFQDEARILRTAGFIRRPSTHGNRAAGTEQLSAGVAPRRRARCPSSYMRSMTGAMMCPVSTGGQKHKPPPPPPPPPPPNHYPTIPKKTTPVRDDGGRRLLGSHGRARQGQHHAILRSTSASAPRTAATTSAPASHHRQGAAGKESWDSGGLKTGLLHFRPTESPRRSLHSHQVVASIHLHQGQPTAGRQARRDTTRRRSEARAGATCPAHDPPQAHQGRGSQQSTGHRRRRQYLRVERVPPAPWSSPRREKHLGRGVAETSKVSWARSWQQGEDAGPTSPSMSTTPPSPPRAPRCAAAPLARIDVQRQQSA